jgi:hydroxyacylglutathione hydrolase
MLKLKKFVFSAFSENTYLIWDELTKEAAIIDPGCVEIFEEENLDQFVQENEVKVKYMINTHCHIDHIFGNAFVKEKYDCLFLAPEKDVPLLEMAVEQGKMFGVEVKPSPKPDQFITEDKKISLGETVPEFIFTPGHTPGEYCIYFPSENFCITGDVLFQEGIGRTDLWGGNYETLIDSITNKLLTLPYNTVIYPGHGDKSTIEHEISHNPFL